MTQSSAKSPLVFEVESDNQLKDRMLWVHRLRSLLAANPLGELNYSNGD
jgi:hypothetical protein